MDLRHFYFHMTMWDYEKKHEENAEWLRKLTVEKYNMKQNDIKSKRYQIRKSQNQVEFRVTG